MPDVQEVFRLVTKEVRPDPGALDRQHRGQRRRAVRQRVAVYALVAVLVIVGLVIAVTKFPGAGTSPKPAGQNNSVSAPAAEQAVIVALDGTTRATVPNIPLGDWSLSPDGTRIAFVDGREGTLISTIGIDGTGSQRLPFPFGSGRSCGEGQCTIEQIAWSSDGSQMAFESFKDGSGDIYVMDADGSNVRKLTDSPADDQWPAWSPNGTTIVYSNTGATPPDVGGFSPTSEIYTVPVSGGAPTRLTDDRVSDSQPEYSPDGTQIAFNRNGGLWIMDADGHNAEEVSLPGNCCTGFTPRWSPDGTRIAFTRDDPTWTYLARPVVAVYVVDLRSGEVSPVGDAEMATDANTPQWLPSGDALLLYRVERP
jgi:hypothetical protein